jgi:diguanylate cyclase (GGDEF)-like protein
MGSETKPGGVIAQHWRTFAPSWHSPFTAPVPDSVCDSVLMLQVARLQATLPRLCACIAAAAVAMALAVWGDLPLWQQLVPPLVIVGTCLAVLVRSRLRAGPATPESARRQLNRTMLVAIGLGAVAGWWCVNAFNETERYYCMVAPVFIGIAALVSATCLLSAPRAAIGAMIMTVAPIAMKMASYPNLGVRAMAAMIVLITLLQGDVVLAKFRETVAMLSLQHELDVLAKSDALTGLDNRRAFMRALDALLARGGTPLVALADLDGFKHANDTFGHHAGDEILIAVAQRLRTVAVTALSVARLGGDEFALLFDAGRGEEQAHREIAALRTLAALPFAYGASAISVGISIGTASGHDDGADVVALMTVADRRLYADKAARRINRAA